MAERIELSKSRALKLVAAWEGHIKNDISAGHCGMKDSKCPIDAYFKELRRKVR